MGLFGTKKTNFYKIKVQCNNCEQVGILSARKGTEKTKAVTEDVCNNCGCQTIKMIDDETYEKLTPESEGLFG